MKRAFVSLLIFFTLAAMIFWKNQVAGVSLTAMRHFILGYFTNLGKEDALSTLALLCAWVIYELKSKTQEKQN